MPPINLKKGTFKESFLEMRGIMRLTSAKPYHFFVPISFSLLSTFFEGVSIGFLIPLIRGGIDKDFSFAQKGPILKNIFPYLPMLPENRNFSILLWLAAIIFSSMLMKNVFGYAASVGYAHLKKDYTNSLRKIIFARVMSFGKLFFDQSGLAYTQTLIMTNTQEIMNRLVDILHAQKSAVVLLIYLGIMLKISWVITIPILFLFPIMDYSLKWLIQKIRKTSEDKIFYRQQFNRKVFNILSCIPLVKAYSQEKKEMEEFGRLNDLSSKFDFSIQKKQALFGPMQDAITLAFILTLVLVMTYISINAPATNMYHFILYFYVLRRFTAEANIFSKFKMIMAELSGLIEELSTLLHDEGKYQIGSGKKIFPGIKENILLKNLSFSYNKENLIVKNLNLSIKRGEILAIVGPTGSGKTTLINILMRFYDCPEGSFYIDGVDAREFDLTSLLSHIAVVSQDAVFFNETLRANLIYGLGRKVSEGDLKEVLKKARLSDLIQTLPQGLDTPIGDRGTRLSGGEKQRLAIARALLKNAEILILDEATSALDSITEKLVQEAIDEILKGRTAIMVAHRLSTIKDADKVVVMEKGEIVEEGTLQELLDKKEKFFAYWQAQKF